MQPASTDKSNTPRTLVIGLTGGIGSGKSTVAEGFAALGVPVIDADLIAREVVEPGQPGLAAVVRAFGAGILGAGGRLDRKRLRERVFAEPAERRRLEALLHPLIRAEMRRRIAACTAPYCLLVVPLLLEGGQSDLVQRILVVDVPEALQVERVLQRDGDTPERVRAILSAQMPRDERLARADDIIANDRELTDLYAEIRRLHRYYLELAANRRDPGD